MSQGKISFACLATDRKLKIFTAPVNIITPRQLDQPSLNDAISISEASEGFEAHSKKGCRVALSASKDWIFTWSEDGCVSVRTLIEPEKLLRFSAHSPFTGGVLDLCVSDDCRIIYSLGSDSLIRVWEWKYTSSGKRLAAEASNSAQVTHEEQGPVLLEYAKNLITFRYL